MLNFYILVLASLGCCNKIPQTAWLLSNRNLFLTALQARSARRGCQPALSDLVRTLFGVAVSQLLIASHTEERAKS